MNTELLEALNILEKEKEISKETLLDAIENSLLNACKNHFGKADNIKVIMDHDTCDYQLFAEKTVVETADAEIAAAGIDMKYQVGTMIETPAAVLIADDLAAECDFFSIGTNDLTQYTCALDRQNAKLEPFFDPHHPAVLKAIQMTIEAGHRHGIWVGICGELGADTALTETFLRMGVDELSMNAKSILPVRKIIRGVDLSKPSAKNV